MKINCAQIVPIKTKNTPKYPKLIQNAICNYLILKCLETVGNLLIRRY